MTLPGPARAVRALALASLLVIPALLPGLAAPAALATAQVPFEAELAPEMCGPGTIVADISADESNVFDVGVQRNRWALDSYTFWLTIYQTEPDTFCAIQWAEGEFVTLAGNSPASAPGAVRRIPAGIRGHYRSGFRTNHFTGTWAPIVPTEGYLGAFDAGCNVDPACPNQIDWSEWYFAGVANLGYDWQGNLYETDANGTWSQVIVGGVSIDTSLAVEARFDNLQVIRH